MAEKLQGKFAMKTRLLSWVKELKATTVPFRNITYTFPGQNYIFMTYFSDFSYAVLGVGGVPVLMALADYLGTPKFKV